MLAIALSLALFLPSPTAVPASTTCPVTGHKDRTLQQNLERALTTSKLSRYSKRQRLAVAVVDLSRADETYYAGINDDHMMYAASLPKIAILLACAEAAANDKLEWTAEHDRRFAAMITESSNADATWGVKLVGYGGIEQVVRDPRYGFYDDERGGLWVGRGYAPAASTSPDPLHNLVHGATARQAARFYTMLAAKKLVSKEWSEHMLSLMGPPKHQHKFVNALAGKQDLTFLARKSGTWKSWHADSALIEHGEHRYVVVALSETRNGEQVMRKVAALVDDLIVAGKHRRPRPTPRA